jgi:hypothetical protein
MAAFPTTWRPKFRGLFPKTMADIIFNLLSDLGAGILKATVFVSDEVTANGSAQSTAHGLASTPTLAFIIPSNLSGGVFVVSYGTNTSTNCVGTVTSGEKYRWVAIK